MAVDTSFENFVREHSRALFSTAFMLTGNRHVAEDLVQDTLASLYPQWDRVMGADAPLAYVRRALSNRYISWQRRPASRDVAMWELPDAWDGRDLGESVASRRTVWQLLAELPERQRTALVMRYFHGDTDAQIADAIGSKPATVRSLLSRGTTTMRNRYTGVAALGGLLLLNPAVIGGIEQLLTQTLHHAAGATSASPALGGQLIAATAHGSTAPAAAGSTLAGTASGTHSATLVGASSVKIAVTLLASAAVITAATVAVVTVHNNEARPVAGRVVGASIVNRVHTNTPPRGSGAPAAPGTSTATSTTNALKTSTGPALPTPPAGFSAVSISFATPTTGYSLGRNVVLRTDDGGRSWGALPLPPGVRGVAGCLNNGPEFACVDHLTFVTPQDGYLWGILWFYATTDGGRSWTNERTFGPSAIPPGGTADTNTIPGGASSVVVSGTHVLRTFPSGGGSSGVPAILQTSTVGSPEWTTITLPNSRTVYAPVPVEGPLVVAPALGFLFVAASKVYGSTDVAYASPDGFRWTRAPLPCGAAVPTSVTGGPTGIITALCGGVSGGSSTLRTSIDGGASYGPAQLASGITAAVALSPDLIIATANPSIGGTQLLERLDGHGATLPGRQPANVVQAGQYPPPPTPEFVTPEFGYLLDGGSTVLVTTDAGASWSTKTFV